MSPKIHNFRESLAKSKAYMDAPWWKDVYEQAFPDLASMEYVTDKELQKRGGDRLLRLHSGAEVLVDEKVRSTAYPDILLELWSDKARQTPGWAQKSLWSDYIAYAFVPTKTCYLLPFQTLRRALRLNQGKWTNQYGFRDAHNRGSYGKYVTRSVPVPLNVLFRALRDGMKITWTSDAPKSTAMRRDPEQIILNF